MSPAQAARAAQALRALAEVLDEVAAQAGAPPAAAAPPPPPPARRRRRTVVVPPPDVPVSDRDRALARHQLARRVLEGAAAGSVPRAHLEELARAVLDARPVRLAREVLRGGEWQLAAGLDRSKLAQQVERAARLAGWMEQGARQGAAETGLELTPGLLTLAALMVAVTEARRGGLTRGQWRLLVWWLRRDLPTTTEE